MPYEKWWVEHLLKEGIVNNFSTYEEKSFWLRDYGPYQASPALSSGCDVDIAVVGGGYTGLSTAREAMLDNPGSSVAVLEGAVIGFGASGRNGGFSMKLFGLEPEVTKARWGAEKTLEAYQYMTQSVERVRKLIEDEKLDSDYRHTGFLRVCYTPKQQARMEKTYAQFREMGLDLDMSYISRDQLREEFHTEQFLSGIFESETGILNPAKHVRELKRLAEQAGAKIYEQTPVSSILRQGNRVVVHTPKGTVRADKVVLATNAFSGSIDGLPKLRSRQAPVWTFITITEPLSRQQWSDIGWARQQGLEDNRQLLHYFRPTVDGRIMMGGGGVTIPYGKGFDHDFSPKDWEHCEAHLKWIFPQLKDVATAYRWGGPVSVNLDMTPEVGFIGDERIIYATGYMGHGVAMSHQNGRLIADLLGEKKTELTDFWIVNRKALPWPGRFSALLGMSAIRRGLSLWDYLEESPLRKHPESQTEVNPDRKSVV